MTEAFADRLRVERERLGLTQEQFAALAGMSRLAQFKYEHDQSMPTVEYLAKLNEAKVDGYYLLTGRRLSSTQVDWDLARDAYAFVHKNFASKAGKSYSSDQLFEVFQQMLLASMQENIVEQNSTSLTAQGRKLKT